MNDAKQKAQEVARNAAKELAMDSSHIPMIAAIIEKNIPLESLIEDSMMLDWYEQFKNHPERYTIGDCIELHVNSNRLGTRAALRIAMQREQEKK